jgi:hypothetical protein
VDIVPVKLGDHFSSRRKRLFAARKTHFVVCISCFGVLENPNRQIPVFVTGIDSQLKGLKGRPIGLCINMGDVDTRIISGDRGQHGGEQSSGDRGLIYSNPRGLR